MLFSEQKLSLYGKRWAAIRTRGRCPSFLNVVEITSAEADKKTTHFRQPSSARHLDG
jgi:hypothetical protein